MPIMLRGFEGIRAYVGFDLGKSSWVEVSPEMLRAFASVTDDRDVMLVDDGGSVAHGYVPLCLMIPMLRDIYLLEDIGPARVCGIDRLRFRAQVPASSSIRLVVRLKSFEATEEDARLTLHCEMECDAAREAVLDGEVSYRLMRSSRFLEPPVGTIRNV
ncbi:MaoC-like dehydratase [Caballeronia terrestris]|uniref:MaoC-like dehydratase n=1 Tax=Caballeronia terrestris TaxID=1226301 RepID=A0A158KC89_9BURK|nr:hypothetical protein [Caballeronia terrestris]SAL78736.1 MaoC-like dehydratase [Caballeronia terrestris]